MEILVEIKWIIEDEQTNGYILQLMEVNADRNRILPVVIGAPEAHAIALELQGIKPFRPFTHDLAVQILESLDTEVKKVVITELNKNTFYASIYLDSNNIGEQIIDSRPSDAIAIAIRVGAPIFVNEEVMETAGLEIDSQTGHFVKGQQSVPEHTDSGDETTLLLNKLEQELQQAVDTENFEMAAKLRDQISMLKSTRKS
jgi:uncharacterized protein